VDAKEFCISSQHPALAGHFPGNPIVPGAVLLDEIISAAESFATGSRIIGIAVAKFMLPLLPGQRCTIELSRQRRDRFDFVCRSQDQVLATGQLVLETHGGQERNESGLATPA
jgi:3-hydroxyacyl-[acyl-carrier-protein] dehydratase